MPEIKFNGESKPLEPGVTAEVFLRRSGFDPATVISVLNGDVVEADKLSSASLKDGDSLDLLRLAGGG